MRITFVTIAVAAAALFVFETSARAEKQEGSFTGCLAKGDKAATFKLTNVGDGKEEFDLVGGGGDLSAHVGHKVEITGHPVSAEQAARAEGGKVESGHKFLRVKSMSHVAATCP